MIKKIICIMAVLCFVSVPFTSITNAEGTGIETFTDPQNNFSFSLPNDWAIITKDTPASDVAYTKYGYVYDQVQSNFANIHMNLVLYSKTESLSISFSPWVDVTALGINDFYKEPAKFNVWEESYKEYLSNKQVDDFTYTYVEKQSSPYAVFSVTDTFSKSSQRTIRSARTICDGKDYCIDLISHNKNLTQEHKSILNEALTTFKPLNSSSKKPPVVDKEPTPTTPKKPDTPIKPATPETLKTYQTSTKGFTLDLPSNWTVITSETKSDDPIQEKFLLDYNKLQNTDTERLLEAVFFDYDSFIFIAVWSTTQDTDKKTKSLKEDAKYLRDLKAHYENIPTYNKIENISEYESASTIFVTYNMDVVEFGHFYKKAITVTNGKEVELELFSDKKLTTKDIAMHEKAMDGVKFVFPTTADVSSEESEKIEDNTFENRKINLGNNKKTKSYTKYIVIFVGTAVFLGIFTLVILLVIKKKKAQSTNSQSNQDNNFPFNM